ncbi:hypothetical protein [Falsiphaeobacter marinintestinus]|uniref:hypothetical protein n=1 Tax=Falsiphaeobacter marinintestinus TaxID=1492905 RepID=UPI0011B5B338|nr:hypothetical protein [Phaeobacter marinintestinus]
MKRLRRLVHGLALATLTCSATIAAEVVDLRFQRSVDIKGADVPYDLRFRLTEVALTRIGVEALLDLQALQTAIVQAYDGDTLIDVCNSKIRLTGVTIKAQDEDVSVEAGMSAEFFDCAREGLRVADRGEQLFAQDVSISATASARIEEQCVQFELDDARVKLTGALEPTADQQEYLDQARNVFLAAVHAGLDKHPICIDLPPQLASLRPSYDDGGTRELGQGGVGVYFLGSVEVSTAAILDVLQVLQSNGVLPPRP